MGHKKQLLKKSSGNFERLIKQGDIRYGKSFAKKSLNQSLNYLNQARDLYIQALKKAGSKKEFNFANFKLCQTEYKKLHQKALKKGLSSEEKERMNNLYRDSRNYLIKGSLEHKSLLSLFIFSFLASLLFLSPNITGNAIGSLSYTDSGFLGILFFVCSLVCVFLYCRKKLKVVGV